MGKFIYTVYAVIVVLATTGASAPGARWRHGHQRQHLGRRFLQQHRLVQRVAQVTVHATPGRHVLADFHGGPPPACPTRPRWSASCWRRPTPPARAC